MKHHEALQAIANLMGNLSDEQIASCSGVNDGAYKAGQLLSAIEIARAALAETVVMMPQQSGKTAHMSVTDFAKTHIRDSITYMPLSVRDTFQPTPTAQRFFKPSRKGGWDTIDIDVDGSVSVNGHAVEMKEGDE